MISSREQLKDYCLRRLGHPVIQINVDDQQIEDRIDDALQFFHEHHFDGFVKRHYAYALTADDLTNKYINTDLVDTNIMSVTRVFESDKDAAGMFSIRYQMHLNDVFNMRQGNVDLTTYDIAKSYLSMVQQFLSPESTITFTKSSNRLRIETDWSRWVEGQYLMIEAYSAINPTEFTEVWNNKDLKRYLTALVKLQWAMNISKFKNVAMLGGVMVDGQTLKEEAMQEIMLIENSIRTANEEPPMFMMG